ncbi:MAG: TlyA family RNA methyltransferase [Lentimicrobiaceae bacterium]|nr:TlyA family RNA methyltransferase [Lentimicrobiaceae bacterium]
MKERLDIVLVLRGLFPSREKAAEAVKNGIIYVNSKQISKSSFKINEEDRVEIIGERLPYVSKGGLKLEKGIKAFHLDFADKTVLDVGCSTGGFADCALQHGADFVYGIDVGNNQLDSRLQNNPRLKYMENLHVKNLQSEHLDGKQMDIILADVSFISVTQALPHILPFLKKNGAVFILIKPQFELDSTALGKNGIVKTAKQQILAIERVLAATKNLGLHLQQIDYAPLMTYKKNIEYIALFSYAGITKIFDIKELVNSAVAEKTNQQKEKNVSL